MTSIAGPDPDPNPNPDPSRYSDDLDFHNFAPGGIQCFRPTFMVAVPKIWDILKKGVEARAQRGVALHRLAVSRPSVALYRRSGSGSRAKKSFVALHRLAAKGAEEASLWTVAAAARRASTAGGAREEERRRAGAGSDGLRLA